MRRNRRVKIVATLGPASSNEATMRALFEAGADVFRINMSHTSPEGFRQAHAFVRKLEKEFSRPIGILVDLQGPKLRIGSFESGAIRLNEGDVLSFVKRESVGGLARVHLPHPEIFKAVEAGHTLLLDDGKFKLKVIEASDVRIDAEVLTSGMLASKKGISLPDTVIPLAAMTDKDHADIEQALQLGVAWIALSFVQRADDVAEAQTISKGRSAIMAKIEKPAAIKQLKGIVELADGIMVATQMLESMIFAPVPTRAEVSDVATAVFEGVDAVMLSAESAVGKYPVEAVATMDRVAMEVERDPLYEAIIHAQRIDPEATGADAISAAARTVAETLNLAAIICYTASGATSLRAARERPQRAILALTPIPATGRKLALVWGLHCVLTDDPRDLDDMVSKACHIAYKEGLANPGERVIISAGVPLGTPGATNMLRIAYVGDDGYEGL
jgi:pyruvate kinase